MGASLIDRRLGPEFYEFACALRVPEERYLSGGNPVPEDTKPNGGEEFLARFQNLGVWWNTKQIARPVIDFANDHGKRIRG
jgi:hypothetical protein